MVLGAVSCAPVDAVRVRCQSTRSSLRRVSVLPRFVRPQVGGQSSPHANVSNQTTYESLESRSRNDLSPIYSGCRSLTYSMRPSRLARLLALIGLGADENRRSNGWMRWLAKSVVEATADALRTLSRFDSTERRRWPVKAAVGSLRGLPPTSHTDAKLRQECPDAVVDFVSYRSNSFQRLARGIGQKPFLVAASGEYRAHVATAHGDYYVSGFEHVVSPAFRLFGGDVDTLFCHRGDGVGLLDRLVRSRPSRPLLDPRRGVRRIPWPFGSGQRCGCKGRAQWVSS